MAWLYLFIAIVCEVIATSTLKATNGFTVPVPSFIVVLGYATSFYFLSLTVKSIPMGVAYAIWCGLGIVLITAIGWLFYQQKLDLAALSGITLIFTGVTVIYLFSQTST